MNKKMLFKCALSMLLTVAMLPLNLVFAADSGLENVALNKTVYSTGYFSEAWIDTNAVDGDLNKGWASGSEIPERKLELASGTGIMLDLEELCLVSEINVRTRRDIDASWDRKGWKVYVSDNAEFKNAELVGTKLLAGVFGEDLEIKLSSSKKIRYIRVVVDSGAITISELEAWGIPLGSGSGFSSYSDMEASNASYLLSYLGIIESGTQYEPLRLVTRKEAANFMMKLLNDASESDKLYFNDVSEDDEYAKIISACCEKGIITQAENFRPDDFISEYEFLVMLLRVLGYNEMPDVDMSSVSSVKNKANELKLLKNTDFGASEGVNRENAMWMMYNALNTQVAKWTLDGNILPQYKTGDYLLTDAFDIILKKGVVTANNETSLYSNTEAAKGHIAVDGTDYTDESETLYKNIGQRIVFGVDKDDTSVIKFGFDDFDKNSTVTVDCEDLKAVSKTSVSYDIDGKTKKYTLDDAKILKNGTAFSDYRMELSYFDVPDGYIELIDNDGDGAYEVVNIMEPTVIEVEKILFGDGLCITAKGGKQYQFDGYDNLDLTVNGRSASEKSFMNAKLILIYASEGRKNISASGYSSYCSGVVGAMTDDELEIDSEQYKLSDYYKSNTARKLTSGAEATVYYADGKIFFYDNTVSAGTEEIGFVLRTKTDECNDTITLRVYTINGVFVDVTAKSKLVVDGSKWTSDKLMSDWSYFNKKFVKFKTNGEGLLTWVDTENYVSASEPDSDMKKLDEISSSCKRSIDGIWSGFAMVAAVKSNMPMFMIPMINGEYETASEFEKYYSVTQYSRVYTYNGQTISDSSSFYQKDDDGYVSFGATAKNIPVIKGTYAPCENTSSPIIVFKNMTQTVNEDNDVVGMINGYDISTGKEVHYTMPSGMLYAVEAPKLVSDKVSGAYSTSSNMALRNADITEEYLYPISSLKTGCVLRTDVSGSLIVGLDLMSDGDWSSTSVYTCMNGLDYIYSGCLTMNITFEKLSGGILTYNTGYGSAIKNYGEFTNMLVIDGNSISKINVSEFPQYFETGKTAFTLFKNGTAVGMVLKK